MDNHEENIKMLGLSLIRAHLQETKLGRHPHIAVENLGGLLVIKLSSEQISERLELRPDYFQIFKDLAEENGVKIEG